MKLAAVIFATVSLVLSAAFAGECVMKIKRDACPGKEAMAYKPYDGKKETEEKSKVADEAACVAAAEKAAKIVRKGTLSAKAVNATHDGKAIPEKTDKAECK